MRIHLTQTTNFEKEKNKTTTTTKKRKTQINCLKYHTRVLASENNDTDEYDRKCLENLTLNSKIFCNSLYMPERKDFLLQIAADRPLERYDKINIVVLLNLASLLNKLVHDYVCLHFISHYIHLCAWNVSLYIDLCLCSVVAAHLVSVYVRMVSLHAG